MTSLRISSASCSSCLIERFFMCTGKLIVSRMGVGGLAPAGNADGDTKPSSDGVSAARGAQRRDDARRDERLPPKGGEGSGGAARGEARASAGLRQGSGHRGRKESRRPRARCPPPTPCEARRPPLGAADAPTRP